MALNSKYGWLDTKHPIYEAWAKIWERNERRMRGGDAVLAELRPFQWENPKGDHYKSRRDSATYLNLPDIFATEMVGHLLKHAPRPGEALDFGALGSVRRDRAGKPTRAELVYYNADGRGSDGSQWDAFWSASLVRAFATGHRWIAVEAPTWTRPGQPSEKDVLEGQRPYLASLSPLHVPNWSYEDGRLAFAIVRPAERRVRLSADHTLEGNAGGRGYVLYVAQGFTGLGAEFQGGGWWRFDAEANPLFGDAGVAGPGHGTWDKTKGQIPLFPQFAKRDEGSDEFPAMSLPLTSELGAIAVAYLNLDSAADFDAWDAGASLTFFAGLDRDGFNLAVEMREQGNQWIPLKPSLDSLGNTRTIGVHDGSTGAVVADVFDRRLAAKLEAARRLAASEAHSDPGSSGVSKEAGFGEVKAPRLAALAEELEQAQNTALYFLELRFGEANPRAAVAWPREFDLAPVVSKIERYFDLQARSGVGSPTATAKLMADAIKNDRLVVDDEELKTIEAELVVAAFEAQERQRQGDAADGVARDAGATPPAPTPPTLPPLTEVTDPGTGS